jgi:hypothetical protein
MTYKRGCKSAALLGIPCLISDVIVRIPPPLYHVAGAHQAAQISCSRVGRWCTG